MPDLSVSTKPFDSTQSHREFLTQDSIDAKYLLEEFKIYPDGSYDTKGLAKVILSKDASAEMY